MRRLSVVRLLFLFPLLICGCGPWSFPAGYGRSYSIEPRKIGSGEQVVTPTNDAWHIDGEPLDLRKR